MNSSGLAKFVRYNRVVLCSKIGTELLVRDNRVSLYFTIFQLIKAEFRQSLNVEYCRLHVTEPIQVLLEILLLNN
jgi:hypothetical protein